MVKLDLLNNRLDLTSGKGLGPRSFDSLERRELDSDIKGNSSRNVELNASNCKLSIKKYKKYKENVASTCHVINTERASPSKSPSRFSVNDRAKFVLNDFHQPTNNSFGIPTNSPTLARSKILASSGTVNFIDDDDSDDVENEEEQELFQENYGAVKCDAKKNAVFYAPVLDKIRDKDHTYQGNTIINRVESKKLPGASWSDASRWEDDQKFSATKKVGPGYYEIYDSQMSDKCMAFSEVDIERGDANQKPTPPIKERLRLERMKKNMESIEGHSLRPSTYTLETQDGFSEGLEERRVLNCPKFPTQARFNSVFYRKEPYTKTSGMKLGLDYDNRLYNKKIPFSFSSSQRKAITVESAGANIDVDTGNYFAIRTKIEKSPVKYAASFRTKAKVGLLIPPTTSPDHIGPGVFGYTGAFKTSVEVFEPDKPSYAFMRNRDFPVREALEDSCEDKWKSFAETHKKGITFSKQGSGFDKNAELSRIVREKMDVIYPRLARGKWPEVYIPPPRPKSDFYPPRDPTMAELQASLEE